MTSRTTEFPGGSAIAGNRWKAVLCTYSLAHQSIYQEDRKQQAAREKCSTPCGDHYAPSLASWGRLLGVSGYIYNGPQGVVGFAPRLGTEDFKTFFTAAEGCGSLVQIRRQGTQRNRIEVKWGRVRVAKVIVELPENTWLSEISLLTRNGTIPSGGSKNQKEVVITLDSQTTLELGDNVEARLEWKE